MAEQKQGPQPPLARIAPAPAGYTQDVLFEVPA